MDEHNVVFIHKGIIPKHKKECNWDIWRNLENIMLSEINQTQKMSMVWFRSDEPLRRGKLGGRGGNLQRGRVQKWCLTIQLQLMTVEKFWIRMGVGNTMMLFYLMALNARLNENAKHCVVYVLSLKTVRCLPAFPGLHGEGWKRETRAWHQTSRNRNTPKD